MDSRAFIIKNYDIPEFWPHIREYLRDVLIKTKWVDRYPLESLYADLVNGVYVCFIVSDGANIRGVAVVEENEYPLGKGMNVFLLSGKDMVTWATVLHKAFIKFANENGITWIDACARFGLGKKHLEALGFRADNIHYTFEVRYG